MKWLTLRWVFTAIRLSLLVVLGTGETSLAAEGAISRIAFGSCNHQRLPQPLWPVIVARAPQLWLWTGDIIYGDSADYDVLHGHYQGLADNPAYQALSDSVPVVGVWDDHDYGAGQGGADFEGKEASRRALLEFLQEPAESPRWERPGIYTSYRFGAGSTSLHLILLDVRFNRQAPGPDADILGAAQWEWLERELAEAPARLTVIVSGTQVLAADHRWDKWADYPQARSRLLGLATEHTGTVLFISGDRHIGELTRTGPDEEPLYDITSSGLTHPWSEFPGEPNHGRVGDVVTVRHFGWLEIDWQAGELGVELVDEHGDAVLQNHLPLPERSLK